MLTALCRLMMAIRFFPNLIDVGASLCCEYDCQISTKFIFINSYQTLKLNMLVDRKVSFSCFVSYIHYRGNVW